MKYNLKLIIIIKKTHKIYHVYGLEDSTLLSVHSSQTNLLSHCNPNQNPRRMSLLKMTSGFKSLRGNSEDLE